MSDIKTMQEMLTGLRQRKLNLQNDEKVFLKLSGINEEIEKASQDKAEYVEKLTAAKLTRDDLKSKKATAVAETTRKISKKMNKVLPYGSAVFTYLEDDDGKRDLKIGWELDGKTTPYNGLSGGERQMFDAALAHVLDANILLMEAAELDDDKFVATLEELAIIEKQVLVFTCHHSACKIPAPFKTIEV